MPKQRKCLGYHVRVEPNNWLYPEDPEKEHDLCWGIADDIRRHVDGLRSVAVICDTEDVCEFCGSPWIEDSDASNGGCCDKDLESEP